jgi:hypothetical protein
LVPRRRLWRPLVVLEVVGLRLERVCPQPRVAIPIFCGLAFEGLSALTPKGSSAQSPFVGGDVSNRVAECVLSALREREKASEVDRERFVSEMSSVPSAQIMQIMKMLPPPPTAAQAEYARNQALARIEGLCKLRISAASQ